MLTKNGDNVVAREEETRCSPVEDKAAGELGRLKLGGGGVPTGKELKPARNVKRWGWW
jgi:hypothetical protein